LRTFLKVDISRKITMDKFSIRSNSLEETDQIAALIAPLLKLDDLIILEGDLGGGKTHFVKAFSKALATTAPVTSPTFAIANFYPIQTGNILHIDAYRLSGIPEYRDLGLDEYYYDSITFIEWGKKLATEFRDYLFLQIHLGKEETERILDISYEGKRWTDRFEEIQKKLVDFKV